MPKVLYRDQDRWVSRLRGNFTGGSYGEGLEMSQLLSRQSFTRQVFFKMMKHHLNLEEEVQLRDYDGVVGHITIAMTRYAFLAVERRFHDDQKTIAACFSPVAKRLEACPCQRRYYDCWLLP